jgi:zinc finger MIZ domain-containing protein
MHQPTLYSPPQRSVDPQGNTTPGLRLYQVVTNLVLGPILVGPLNTSQHFLINLAQFDRRVRFQSAHSAAGIHGTNDFRPGSLRWRLKSIESFANQHIPNETEFILKPTDWPKYAFFSFNACNDVLLKRKKLFGKDMAVDLTPHVVVNQNAIQHAWLHDTERPTAQHYYAIEQIEIFAEQQLKDFLNRDEAILTREQALANHVAALKPSTTAVDDEDIAILDTSTVSIDLVDPFSATLITIPVRGKDCKHRECFDLDTFLQSRPVPHPGGPTSADDWKCPLCQGDARPQSLILDGFLRDVVTELREQGKTDVKAIALAVDGTWTVKSAEAKGGEERKRKRDVGDEAEDGKGREKRAEPVEVIELD